MGIFTKTGYNKKYLWTHPWELLFHYGRDLKCAYQRAVKGYCFRDLWAIDSWFLELMPRMLTEFKSKNDGYPADMEDPKDWDKILDHMIFCFKEANEETSSLKNEFNYNCDFNFIPKDENISSLEIVYPTEEDKNNADLYYQKELQLMDYREAKLSEGLELFSKHVRSLWY